MRDHHQIDLPPGVSPVGWTSPTPGERRALPILWGHQVPAGWITTALVDHAHGAVAAVRPRDDELYVARPAVPVTFDLQVSSPTLRAIQLLAMAFGLGIWDLPRRPQVTVDIGEWAAILDQLERADDVPRADVATLRTQLLVALLDLDRPRPRRHRYLRLVPDPSPRPRPNPQRRPRR